MMKRTSLALGGALVFALAAGGTTAHAQYRQQIAHDASICSGEGPAVWVTIDGIKPGGGLLRIQSYRATKKDWLEKGQWVNRIEIPAKPGRMQVCMPVPRPGHYGIAVRHDVNKNGKTDIRKDGGAMSNNPSLNIFNLGKPSYKKVGFDVGREVKPITINMRYF